MSVRQLQEDIQDALNLMYLNNSTEEQRENATRLFAQQLSLAIAQFVRSSEVLAGIPTAGGPSSQVTIQNGRIITRP